MTVRLSAHRTSEVHFSMEAMHLLRSRPGLNAKAQSLKVKYKSNLFSAFFGVLDGFCFSFEDDWDWNFFRSETQEAWYSSFKRLKWISKALSLSRLRTLNKISGVFTGDSSSVKSDNKYWEDLSGVFLAERSRNTEPWISSFDWKTRISSRSSSRLPKMSSSSNKNLNFSIWRLKVDAIDLTFPIRMLGIPVALPLLLLEA